MPIALIPARLGSKGIPGKNFNPIDNGPNPVERAVTCCVAAGIVPWVSSNKTFDDSYPFWIARPDDLATDLTPMSSVVNHFLNTVDGPDDEIILLVQPTQPLRQPKHLREAVKLLEEGITSLASVVQTDSIQKLYTLVDGKLMPCSISVERRQLAKPTYRCDGTVYAFRRYPGYPAKFSHALVIPPEESTPLDTPLDWQIAELRLRHAR